MSADFFEKAIPSVLERYELKYTIPIDMVDDISDFISAYCTLDKFSELSEDEYYEVNSLYFDSPEYTFLKNRIESVQNRFNMRIRSYGTGENPPYFYEIKQKTGDISKKFRSQINGELDQIKSHSALISDSLTEDDRKNLELFIQLHEGYNATPKVLTSYRRKAYISDYDLYARVTFDKELSYTRENKIVVTPPRHRMNYYDHEEIFDDGCNVVLELKCLKSYVPHWMLDLITKFDLKRVGFSKYANSLKDLFIHE